MKLGTSYQQAFLALLGPIALHLSAIISLICSVIMTMMVISLYALDLIDSGFSASSGQMSIQNDESSCQNVRSGIESLHSIDCRNRLGLSVEHAARTRMPAEVPASSALIRLAVRVGRNAISHTI